MLKCGDKVKTRHDITCDGGIWDYHISIEKGEIGVVVNVSTEDKDVYCDVFFDRKNSDRSRIYKDLSITYLFLESGTKIERIEHLALTRQIRKNKKVNGRKCMEKHYGKKPRNAIHKFKNRIRAFVS